MELPFGRAGSSSNVNGPEANFEMLPGAYVFGFREGEIRPPDSPNAKLLPICSTVFRLLLKRVAQNNALPKTSTSAPRDEPVKSCKLIQLHRPELLF